MTKLDRFRRLDELHVELAAATTNERKQLVLAEILAERGAMMKDDGTDQDVVIDVPPGEAARSAAWFRQSARDREARAALYQQIGNHVITQGEFEAKLAMLDQRELSRADYKTWRTDGEPPPPAPTKLLDPFAPEPLR